MSAKKTGHRRQEATPARHDTTTDTRYDDMIVVTPRFISASDKLARSQREQIRRRNRGDARQSCRSNGNGYYAERLHTWSTRTDTRGNIFTCVCDY